jgi:SAM-dependent methyltransferase
MPVGHAGLSYHLVDFIQRAGARSVLDLGVGYGLNGATLVNYFGANPNTGSIYPRGGANDFRVHGVEVFPAYRNPMWDLYVEVVVGPIENWLHLCEMVDAVVCNDVFEHLPKHVGEAILRRSKRAFVGVCQEMGQGTVYGNPHEAHTTMWTEAELKKFCSKTFELNAGYIVGMKTGVEDVKRQASAFWEAKDDTDAKRLIGPANWGRPAEYYVAELFDSDPACTAFFKSLKKKKPDLLEIGCGQGRILREIAPLFKTVHGLDISDGMLTLAEPYLKGTGVKLGKIVDCVFPVENTSVDLVFSTIVFQHIQDRETIQKYLAESLRVLRPGGMIRVQTHRGSPPPAGTFGGFHGHFYPTVDAFAAEFAAAGFKVVSKQTGIGHAEWLWVTAGR